MNVIEDYNRIVFEDWCDELIEKMMLHEGIPGSIMDKIQVGSKPKAKIKVKRKLKLKPKPKPALREVTRFTGFMDHLT